MTPPSSGKAHVFVGDLDLPVLDDDDHRHLTRALRLVAGAELTVSDGRGRWRHCRLGTGVELSPTSEIVADPRPAPELTVAFALVKGDRPELVVQKLTELGMDRIVPFVAERSVVRWDPDKTERNHTRLAKIVREAAMQSRRSYIPVLSPVVDFAAAAALPGACLADPTGAPPNLTTPTVLIGPEGGWGPGERAVGVPFVRLGDHVLRAETASLTAGALLGALRSRVVMQAFSSSPDSPHGP